MSSWWLVMYRIMHFLKVIVTTQSHAAFEQADRGTFLLLIFMHQPTIPRPEAPAPRRPIKD